MSQADLARKANIGRGSISDLVSGRRSVGKDVAIKIADTLKLPRETVFRAAGILEENGRHDPELDEIIHHVKDLNKPERDAVLAFIQALDKLRRKNKP